MSKRSVIQTNFSAGELSRLMMGRFDLAKFNNGGRLVENFLINQLGGASFRPGTRYIAETKTSSKLSRLLPFQYSADQDYVVELGDEYMRFFSNTASAITANLELDYMEYATDGAAQAAYVTNFQYTVDLCSGGASLSSGDYAGSNKDNAFDNDAGTYWYSSHLGADILNTAYIGYDFGVGVTKHIRRITIDHHDTTAYIPATANIRYSDNGTDWTVHSGITIAASGAKQTFDLAASGAHRYWSVLATAALSAGQYWVVGELEMMEESLQSYSEATIKNQGSYSLKGLAGITSTLNKTLTKTFATAKDLTNYGTIKLYIRSSRTGSNIKIGIHDAGGTTTETTPNITVADTWQLVTWDVSAVAAANKDAIDSIIITIVNADAANTFYVDDCYGVFSELVSPYDETEIFDVFHAHKNDVKYLTHLDYAPRKLSRTSSTTFNLALVSFVRGPFLDDNITATTITPSAATGAGITLTASTSIFDATHVGSLWKVNAAVVKITAYTSGTVVTGDVQAEPTGVAGNIGGTTAYTAWAEGAFSAYRGYPKACAFHDGRIYYANTDYEPQKIWASVVNSYDNFKAGTDADDALTFELATEERNAIQWIMSSKNSLIIGTSGGTFSASGVSGGIIKPTDIQVERDTNYGVAEIAPRRLGSFVYFIQRNLHRLRELIYSFTEDTNKAQDMNLLAEHILRDGDGGIEIDAQQSPNDRLWCVREDGQIAVLTRNFDQEVMAWSRIIAGTDSQAAGEFESLCIINKNNADDQVWVIVKRVINGTTRRFIEQFMPENFDDDWDAINLDCSLTLDSPVVITGATKANPVVVTAAAHGFSNGDYVKIDNVEGMTQLNGNTYKVANKDTNTFQLTSISDVNVNGTAYSTYISGGEVRKKVTAISGLSHLEGEVVEVQADGAPVAATYTVSGGAITLATRAAVVHVGLPYTGTLQLANRDLYGRIYHAWLKVYRSYNFKIGHDTSSLATLYFELTDVASDELYTGDVDGHFTTGWNEDNELMIVQDAPAPLTVLSIELDIDEPNER